MRCIALVSLFNLCVCTCNSQRAYVYIRLNKVFRYDLNSIIVVIHLFYIFNSNQRDQY